MMMIGSSVDYVRSRGMRNAPVTKAVEHLYAINAKFSGCVLLASRPAYSYPPRRTPYISGSQTFPIFCALLNPDISQGTLDKTPPITFCEFINNFFQVSVLIKYSETSLLIDEEFHIDKDVPIIVMGDFNVDVKRNEKALGFMKKHFDLNTVPTNYPSTLGNSYVDSTFTRTH
ncbi:hypothetical protein AVEN_91524-1 [Araneus ventricosus]|uniref:Endonuclease/exonuclease/phosphatase domain-containing protein n=1 Tax=Araneus ventricosus TaxID=182803 RepID=A0A4Y2BKA3_ARAVE|nr:hypothetical protein AVEN_91524-1 [Araneus ventricosus]